MLYFCWLFSELWPLTAFNRSFRLSFGPGLLKVTKTHTDLQLTNPYANYGSVTQVINVIRWWNGDILSAEG